MTTEAVLFTGVSGCVSAIVVLFGLEMQRHKATTTELEKVRLRLDRCEADRHLLAIRVAVIEEPVKGSSASARRIVFDLDELVTLLSEKLGKLKSDNEHST